MTTGFTQAQRAEHIRRTREENAAAIAASRRPNGARTKYLEQDVATQTAEIAALRNDVTALTAQVETIARVVSGLAADMSDLRSFTRMSPQAGGNVHWWDWVDQRLDELTDEMHESVGLALGEMVGRVRDELEQRTGEGRREHELLRRELGALRNEVGIERGLDDLRSQVAKAQRAVPKVPANRGSAPRGGHDGETVGRAIAKAEYARRTYEGPFLEGEAKPVRTVNLIASPLGRR